MDVALEMTWRHERRQCPVVCKLCVAALHIKSCALLSHRAARHPAPAPPPGLGHKGRDAQL